MDDPRTDRPAVAVIMPCHNSASTLSQAVESVLAQTFEDWELVISDDGSTDDSPALIRQFMRRDARIRTLRNDTASGVAAARNRALKSTQARYVAFLDSDDAWLPNKLALQLTSMREQGAALVCAAYDVMDGDGRITGHVRPASGRLTYRGLLANCSVGCLTVMIDRQLTGPISFDTRLPKSEDYHLWLSLVRRGFTAVCLVETVALYRVHGTSLSSNKLSAARNRWRVYRELEGHGILTSSVYFAAYAVTGLMKSLAMRRNRFLRASS